MDQAWTMVVLSLIVLVAYLFDFFGRFTRVPAVVSLIFTGLVLRAVADAVGWQLALPAGLLPVLGTFGLILIVLEGTLDLRLTRERVPMILRAAGCATLGVVLTGALFAGVLVLWLGASWQLAVVHALPFAVISSAVVIPAAVALSERLREFVIYESSISDIVGVVLFYALLREYSGPLDFVFSLGGELLLSVFVGLVMGLSIFWLIQRIEHHVRVLPMIFGITLLYSLGKILHLAPLVMVVLVGLLLNNSHLIARFSRGRLAERGQFEQDLESFKHLTVEFTFVVRSFFFVLLGFGVSAGELLSTPAWVMAVLLMGCSLLPRWALLRGVARERAQPLLWFAPRGLITVLLFMSIPESQRLEAFPVASLMLVILMGALLLTYGSLQSRSLLAADEASAQPSSVTKE
ncbi:MAG: hypothetical protein CGU28_11990 [Candidatus Dactylopiibacterium carminicum]|nr:MAG: hypothetical protein CGU28_11990 [Candidatus Dactylopiibacterium carminicum]